ncbi:MAG: prolipoprotein diacylglyceryl transferase [Ignavibacteriales bacterium]|nr:MAG: prolipoprotein diacylglyceryl transferase [Ignavibacteriaceae bacterium]MBW7872776.1 prolipoprotein diacylglyceryl transferase [Ignavibacteria bacterium]MCZ2143496.1 prolipoprotein diacylglyceryl transferase [Ignavibacteriales bacterium]OQY72511.1 MAG: prolipoprotein diacylglyceryl transferase [Ignavibacteriales bacterium UTCHB3]MBV6444373.1 Prolipoprotein diacylglyceryl transferase [Ignavibacteriaceae bacterium]
MYPEIISIGPFTVHSYGLMLGIAFIVASWMLTKEFERRGIDTQLATEITLLAIVFGVIGSKLFHLFANMDEFFNDPIGALFSPGGLTFHGGLLLAMLAIYIRMRQKKVPFLFIADCAAPALAIAYGIGRIGCHLAGDGDYGIPTSLPWGTNYENGIVKPSLMFMGSDIAKGYPNGIVPDNTPLHPTPIYEFLLMIVLMAILLHFRKKDWPIGKLFSVYLLGAGLERFSIEFIRLNPRLLFGLSEAQLVAVGLMAAGAWGLFYYTYKNPDKPRFVVPDSLKPKKKTGEQKKKKAN